uniref:Uncharacterized protein n=1 Tax=Hordeum vulgare subsp. vulgare TaxID=112509 RepID=A0A8I6WRC1_HORVV
MKNIPEGKKSALLDRRNASFEAKRRTPRQAASSLDVNKSTTSSSSPPTGAASLASPLHQARRLTP